MKFFLIHGSWHGTWCWDKLASILEQTNHTVIRLDLPGCGADADNAENIEFKDYYNFVRDHIAKMEEPIVVVAHSSAGLFAAGVCEELHDKIAHVFYIAAWLPTEGKSLANLSTDYNNSDFYTTFVDCGNPKLRALDPERAKLFLYNDCTPEEQNWAAARLRPKAVQPDHLKMRAVIPTHSLSKSTYILCELDRVVNPLSQLDMATRFGFADHNILRINTGHSPFLAQPKELADQLASALRKTLAHQIKI